MANDNFEIISKLTQMHSKISTDTSNGYIPLYSELNDSLAQMIDIFFLIKDTQPFSLKETHKFLTKTIGDLNTLKQDSNVLGKSPEGDVFSKRKENVSKIHEYIKDSIIACAFKIQDKQKKGE